MHRDPYVPFTLPARGLRPGQVNTLVIRVDNRKGKEPREGWWNWGGIIAAGHARAARPRAARRPGADARRSRAARRDDCDGCVLLDGGGRSHSRRPRTPAP